MGVDALPLSAMNSCDIAVIGGGAAGLAATRTLIERGLSAICIEARDRIGGRAWTDSETFGVPFDRGYAWLHSGRYQSWRPIAAELGPHRHRAAASVARSSRQPLAGRRRACGLGSPGR
jgi:monoamine oxidase